MKKLILENNHYSLKNLNKKIELRHISFQIEISNIIIVTIRSSFYKSIFSIVLRVSALEAIEKIVRIKHFQSC